MTPDSRFSRLKTLTDRIGLPYGTEDWCVFLYALVKMHVPVNVMELGTGLGATSLWVALAMQENGVGRIQTVDDGRDWPGILKTSPDLFSDTQRVLSFPDYLHSLREEFGLEKHLEFVHRVMPPLPPVDQKNKIDMLFSDFMHGTDQILNILGHFLPHMAPSSSIFIDSASTSFPSFAMLELLVQHLNAGKPTQMLLSQVHPRFRDGLQLQIRNSAFSLVHLVEKKSRAQNSTAWLKIQPADLRPYPSAPFH